MANVRVLNEKKYGITKWEFTEVHAHCLQYLTWKKKLEALKKVPDSDTFETRILKEKIRKVEEIARSTAEEKDHGALYPYLLEYVTTEGATYDKMQQKGMPCGATLFYDLRRRFYCRMAKEI